MAEDASGIGKASCPAGASAIKTQNDFADRSATGRSARIIYRYRRSTELMHLERPFGCQIELPRLLFRILFRFELCRIRLLGVLIIFIRLVRFWINGNFGRQVLSCAGYPAR